MVLVNRNVAPSFNTIIEILQNDQRKIKLIRKYENTRKKIINNECAILFNKTCIYIYMNDMHKASSLQCIHYADDTTLFSKGNNLDDLIVFTITELVKMNK